MEYARIENNIVMEIIDFNPSGKFHSSIKWVAVDNEVDQKWETKDGKLFEPPVAINTEKLKVEAPIYRPVLPVVRFKLCFKQDERIAIYAMRETDPRISDLISILDDPRTDSVDLNLSNIQNMIRQLVDKIPDFDETRVTEVLSGKMI